MIHPIKAVKRKLATTTAEAVKDEARYWARTANSILITAIVAMLVCFGAAFIILLLSGAIEISPVVLR